MAFNVTLVAIAELAIWEGSKPGTPSPARTATAVSAAAERRRRRRPDRHHPGRRNRRAFIEVRCNRAGGRLFDVAAHPYCHPGEDRDPRITVRAVARWIPAFAGMTISA
jgi:hypothetical protein